MEHVSFHNEEHYSSKCPKCKQEDKLETLRKEVQSAKENDFAEIPGASKFRKIQLDGGQFVYNRVLRLIRIAGGGK